MLEEDQISFRSASLMFDGVEDYSHQIAEMIGLRNESSFIQAGVSMLLHVGTCYNYSDLHTPFHFLNPLLLCCITLGGSILVVKLKMKFNHSWLSC